MRVATQERFREYTEGLCAENYRMLAVIMFGSDGIDQIEGQHGRDVVRFVERWAKHKPECMNVTVFERSDNKYERVEVLKFLNDDVAPNRAGRVRVNPTLAQWSDRPPHVLDYHAEVWDELGYVMERDLKGNEVPIRARLNLDEVGDIKIARESENILQHVYDVTGSLRYANAHLNLE